MVVSVAQASQVSVLGRQGAMAHDVSPHPHQIYRTSRYEGVYAKTPQGWKFKSRKP